MKNSPLIIYDRPFLVWLLFIVLVFIGFYLAFDFGILHSIVETDLTYISLVILLLLLALLCHGGSCAWRLSRQQQFFQQLHSRQKLFAAGESFAQDYLSAIKLEKNSTEQVVHSEVLAEKTYGAHQVGWFFVSLMIKLGLLGTVIGFVIMLSSVSQIKAVEVSDIQGLMQQMTQGMRVAMNTTMAGLVASMLLGLQYLFLDRFAKQFLLDLFDFSKESE